MGSVHGTDTKSTVLEYLEKWYNRNLTNYKTDEDGNFIDENNSITTNPIIDSNKIDYSTHIDNEAGFCGDRTAYTDSNGTTEGGGTGTTETHYGAYIRLIKHNPTFECLNEEDLYNVRVGLITSDEVIFAGGKYYGPNYNYYLYTGNWYWTLSPNVFNGADAHVSIVDYDGDASVIDVDDSYSGVRPVINLSADKLTISGSGTIESPYVIN